jgi:hypothetical protein
MSVLATIDHSKVSEFMWEVMEKTHNANYLVGLNLNGPLETNPSIQYEVPLNEAVKSGILASVIGLLHFGANPNIPDLNGNTALHLACENGELNIVTELVRNKADPEAINKACKKPLELVESLAMMEFKYAINHGLGQILNRNNSHRNRKI